MRTPSPGCSSGWQTTSGPSATRGSKTPSLLQGLAACTACGYGYYRTSTRTARRKIYYYRCLGSDDYLYEGGRVCGNKPVRAGRPGRRPRCLPQARRRYSAPGRAAMLAVTLPASTAAHDQRRQQRADGLRKKLTKIDVSERALVTELETPIDPADPAAQALRNRVRARFTELYADRTGIETELATLGNRPHRTRRPHLAGRTARPRDILTDAPAALTERLLAAFDIQAVYNRDKYQVTIHATLTDATPQAVLDLLSDPRADHNRQAASGPAPAPQDHVAHLTGHTGSSPRQHSPVCYPVDVVHAIDGPDGAEHVA